MKTNIIRRSASRYVSCKNCYE